MQNSTQRFKSSKSNNRLLGILTSKPFFIVISLYLIIFSELLAMTVYAQMSIKYNPEVPVLYIPKKAVATVAKPAPAPQPAVQAQTNYPYRISIPKLGINSGVLSLGINNKGEMAVPATLNETSWYNKGAKPGEVGSAVITGHYGAPNQQGVFKNIKNLQNGDTVTITDSQNRVYNYVVYKNANVGENNAPLQEIFSRRDGKYLNLITCFGVWNQESFSYDQRTVVYTKLVNQ